MSLIPVTNDADLAGLTTLNIPNYIDYRDLKENRKYLIKSFHMFEWNSDTFLVAVLERESQLRPLILSEHVTKKASRIVQKLKCCGKLDLHKPFYLIYLGKILIQENKEFLNYKFSDC